MASYDANRISEIVSKFLIPSGVTRIIPWGNGLINDTFRIYTDSDTDYLMQKMNESVYHDLDGMMNNIYLVTEYIKKRTFLLRNGEIKQALSVIPTRDHKYYYRDKDNNCWRIYNFMKNSYSMETSDNSFESYKVGVLLGQFHYLLADFPVEKLTTIIPDFHNPCVHYRNLLKAARNDTAGRKEKVEAELSFFTEHAFEYDMLNRLYDSGQLGLCVNHNDPKVNNFMFDTKMKEPICLIDLDTMMPGLLPYDFGDAIRSMMCTGKDTGPDMDISRIQLDLEIYREFLKGFLEGCEGLTTGEKSIGIITPALLEALPLGARLIALESAMRYLADYLNGDVYFKIRYPEQNLIKCRMHIRLYQDICRKLF